MYRINTHICFLNPVEKNDRIFLFCNLTYHFSSHFKFYLLFLRLLFYYLMQSKKLLI